MSSDKVYIAIDLKSFYASVECIERKLNPMTTNLVVADMTDKKKIPIEQVRAIEGDLFKCLEL